MKVIALLIFATACIAPIAATEYKLQAHQTQVPGYVAKIALSCLTEAYKTLVKGVYGSHDCAKECNEHTDCQGFRLTDHGCEIFRFTACSRNLVQSMCTRTNRIWIRNIPGLPAGRLCPSGYEGRHGASTYKIFPVSSWKAGAEKCREEKGLVKYADADDKEEDLHLHKLKRMINADHMFYIGGKLTSHGKYEWETCRHEIQKNLWAVGQPSSRRCCVVVSGGLLHGLDDIYNNKAHHAMCECVNPFE